MGQRYSRSGADAADPLRMGCDPTDLKLEGEELGRREERASEGGKAELREARRAEVKEIVGELIAEGVLAEGPNYRAYQWTSPLARSVDAGDDKALDWEVPVSPQASSPSRPGLSAEEAAAEGTAAHVHTPAPEERFAV